MGMGDSALYIIGTGGNRGGSERGEQAQLGGKGLSTERDYQYLHLNFKPTNRAQYYRINKCSCSACTCVIQLQKLAGSWIWRWKENSTAGFILDPT
jgi:hypothetical protein